MAAHQAPPSLGFSRQDLSLSLSLSLSIYIYIYIYIYTHTHTCCVLSYSDVSSSLWPHGLYSPWNSPGQNTGEDSLSLLQGVFPTQESNPGLPHCRWTLYQLSHKGSPRILEWVAFSYSRGSSWPRNRTGVSCVAGGLFTNWSIREAYIHIYTHTHTNIWASQVAQW